MAGDLMLESLAERIIGAAIEVHRRTGPGLMESVCEECLAMEFGLVGLRFERQVSIPISYRDRPLEVGYRLDFLVEGLAVVELKAVERLLPVHEAQLLTYIRLSGRRVGLLINFNVPVLVNGVVRRVV